MVKIMIIPVILNLNEMNDAHLPMARMGGGSADRWRIRPMGGGYLNVRTLFKTEARTPCQTKRQP